MSTSEYTAALKANEDAKDRMLRHLNRISNKAIHASWYACLEQVISTTYKVGYLEGQMQKGEKDEG